MYKVESHLDAIWAIGDQGNGTLFESKKEKMNANLHNAALLLNIKIKCA